MTRPGSGFNLRCVGEEEGEGNMQDSGSISGVKNGMNGDAIHRYREQWEKNWVVFFTRSSMCL